MIESNSGTSGQAGLSGVHITRLARVGLFSLVLLATNQATGQPEIEHPIPETTDHPMELEATGIRGNPARTVAEGWPEDLVVAPVPGRSPELGWKLALGLGYFFDTQKQREDDPSSLVGIVAMGAENGSHAYGAGGSFHLLEDKLRLVSMLGEFKYNYRFWGIGNDAGDAGRSLDLSQRGTLFYTSALYELGYNIYTGLGYLGGQSDIRFQPGAFPVDGLPGPEVDIELGALELPLKFDNRDQLYFPRQGSLISTNLHLYREDMGSDFDAEIFSLAANHYIPIRERDVLALRAYYRSASGNAPFFLLSSFGGKSDLRGYDVGRYRDNDMYAIQGEYRWHASDSWVFTGFVGVGEVAGHPDDFFENYLPAAGVGTRFILSKKHQVSLSADLSVGKNGTQFYFGVGEAF